MRGFIGFVFMWAGVFIMLLTNLLIGFTVFIVGIGMCKSAHDIKEARETLRDLGIKQ
ncbi:hypothetical protein FP74_gp118 [Bacillus phage CAM003]|uniref:Uncharacterized protein n=3 Tax=Bastillevirus TaxID=1918010 RepID=A0A024B143_9CAUD|nr:hypothetical protein FP74_gp118 [Bacillus phage CAM003]ASR79650.1 hypothetical protein OTK52_253 [Bacillus phage OTooleKemple52]ASU01096.1 hypothetical protein ANTHONY_256 [Bacillus phage Anthony]AXQ67093.1 hypothetical protein KAMFAM_255 [Bacillus phage Kamfam]AZF89343.1 hypothetical protein Goe5_c02370 [Bacillus phage vB_BthM-Goe5]AHZ09678.1 hypothetical protein [Bacillus phage CAM003]